MRVKLTLENTAYSMQSFILVHHMCQVFVLVQRASTLLHIYVSVFDNLVEYFGFDFAF